MFNPLLENVQDLKDSELESKINEVGRKYQIASRTMSGSILIQLAVCLEAYRNELSRRHSEKLKDLAQKSNKNLEGLIKVN
jgi:hypothetical protein